MHLLLPLGPDDVTVPTSSETDVDAFEASIPILLELLADRRDGLSVLEIGRCERGDEPIGVLGDGRRGAPKALPGWMPLTDWRLAGAGTSCPRSQARAISPRREAFDLRGDASEIVSALLFRQMSDWAVWTWFETPSPWLAGRRSPAQALAEGDREALDRAVLGLLQG